MGHTAGMNFKSWLLTGTLCIAGLAATQAQAQTAPAESTTATEIGHGSLQEVVVTATRREESLSKVPISVTALTQETMDEKGMKDFQDIVRFTPGVNIDNSGTNAISIRGISSSGGAGTTGIYIDDTPIQMRSVGFSPDDTLPKTFDLQRVEVLRGPQGTLFGAGAEGGAVRYILTPASTTTADTYVRTKTAHGGLWRRIGAGATDIHGRMAKEMSPRRDAGAGLCPQRNTEKSQGWESRQLRKLRRSPKLTRGTRADLGCPFVPRSRQTPGGRVICGRMAAKLSG